MNKVQAFKRFCSGKEVYLEMKYFERLEYFTFNPYLFSYPVKKDNFDYILQLEKSNFKKYATFFGGNKSDCKFKFVETKNY